MKENVTAYIKQWISFHVADDIVKQREKTQKNFGIINEPTSKRHKNGFEKHELETNVADMALFERIEQKKEATVYTVVQQKCHKKNKK